MGSQSAKHRTKIARFHQVPDANLTVLHAHYIMIPAMVAERYEAIVPQNNALKPNFARSARRPGAMAPIPPICIPTLLKFANPQIAILTTNRPFWDMMGTAPEVRLLKATNSFTVSFCPSKVAALRNISAVVHPSTRQRDKIFLKRSSSGSG